MSTRTYEAIDALERTNCVDYREGVVAVCCVSEGLNERTHRLPLVGLHPHRQSIPRDAGVVHDHLQQDSRRVEPSGAEST